VSELSHERVVELIRQWLDEWDVARYELTGDVADVAVAELAQRIIDGAT
jgi:hypothetical protein